MKTTLKWMLISALISAPWVAAQENTFDEQALYDSLRLQLERACPVQWQALDASMNTESLNDVIWVGDATVTAIADKTDFKDLMSEIITSSTEEELEAMAEDMATVATECASHRVALLDALISKTPRDVLLAMDAVNKGLNKSIEYLDGGWSVGDVRVTGRLTAQEGWVFLIGQTLGNANTSADLAGDEYNELFELAKNWAPNVGTEDWAAGQLVTIPDMRSRVLMAPDNMGGVPADIVTSAAVDQVGGVFGDKSKILNINHLPAHNHTLTSEPNHGHTLGSDSHKHKLRTSAYDGGNVGYVNYMEGKGRTNYQNHITQTILVLMFLTHG